MHRVTALAGDFAGPGVYFLVGAQKNFFGKSLGGLILFIVFFFAYN